MLFVLEVEHIEFVESLDIVDTELDLGFDFVGHRLVVFFEIVGIVVVVVVVAYHNTEDCFVVECTVAELGNTEESVVVSDTVDTVMTVVTVEHFGKKNNKMGIVESEDCVVVDSANCESLWVSSKKH